MAAKAFSVIRKSSLVESLSQASFSSRSYTSVKHSISPIASHYALGKEFTKAGAFLGSGIVSRSLTCSPGLGSIVAQPHCQASLGSYWISQSARSYSTSGMYPNIRLRFQKQRRDRGPIKGTVINCVSFGKYGLEASESAWISTKQITAAQLAIKRNMKGGKIFLRVFPHKPISRKPAETRMGRGKGAVAFWAARVKAGRILFEIDGVPESVAQRAITVAGSKLPIKTKFVKSSG